MPQSRKLGMVLIVGFHIAAVVVFWLLRGSFSPFCPSIPLNLAQPPCPTRSLGQRWLVLLGCDNAQPQPAVAAQDRFAPDLAGKTQYGMPIVVVLLVGIVLLFLARGASESANGRGSLWAAIADAPSCRPLAFESQAILPNA